MWEVSPMPTWHPHARVSCGQVYSLFSHWLTLDAVSWKAPESLDRKGRRPNRRDENGVLDNETTSEQHQVATCMLPSPNCANDVSGRTNKTVCSKQVLFSDLLKELFREDANKESFALHRKKKKWCDFFSLNWLELEWINFKIIWWHFLRCSGNEVS